MDENAPNNKPELPRPTNEGDHTQGEATAAGNTTTIAQGPEARAVGERGVHVDGDVRGDIITGDRYGLSIEEVAALVVELELKRKDQPTVWDGRIPYLGLQAFQEDDAEFFFGREMVVTELLARVEHGSFLAIAGPSGSGKSSVARAGLLHALQQGRLETSERWLLVTMHPGGDPLAQLAQAVNRLAQSPTAGNYIYEKGLTDPHALHEQIEVLLKEDRRQRAVLLVDQFEEIFSPNQDEAARIAFINLLAAAQHPQSRLNIILTLRSDFIPACADYPQLNELINRQFYQIGAMTPRESGTAIVLPALEVGVKIDTELVAHVTADMKGEPGALPLMSFVLRDLFQAAPKKKGEPLTLGVSDYLQRGGLEHALQRHADEVFAQFSAPQQALARHIFSRLVDVDERIDTRCTVTLNELVPMGETIEAAAAVIRALSGDKARLLTTDRVDSDEMGTPTSTTVTLAHEKLIDAWPWLRQLVDENRKLIALQNQIANDAQVWAREQDAGYLYRSGRLAQVEKKLAELQPNLNDLSQQFVEASRSEQKRQQAAEEQQRRNEAELYIQREVKKRIQASQLAFAAKAELARDPERALLLAIAGLGINIQPNTYLALADSLQSHYRTTFYGHEAGIVLAVFSPDGQTILTAGCDEQGTGDHCTSTARLWDRQGNQLAVLRGHENVIWSIAFSPDGQTILTASEDGTVRLWDRQGNELAVVLRGLGDGANSTVLSPYGANSAVFSPDGQAILTTAGFGFSDAEEFDWTDYMAQLWDLQGNELAVLRGGKYVVSSAKFSPDGQTILTIGLGLDKFEGFNYINDTVRLWSLQGKELTVLSGHEDTITSAVFSPDGQTILTTSNDDTARLWDREGNDLAILQHEGGVNSAVFSPDGQMILTAGSADSTARLWDLQGNLLSALREHLRDVNSAIFSPDGQIILTASEDNTARLWDLQGNVLTILSGHRDSVTSAVFSPDGQVVLTISEDQTARLWDVQKKELIILTGHKYPVYSAVFSPDDQNILTASRDKTARLWDRQGKELVVLPGHRDDVNLAVFSPDGQTILTASDDLTARLWNKQGKELLVLGKHKYAVTSAVFSPDGQAILTASSFGRPRLWDRQGIELVALPGYGDRVTSAVFSPDGQTILTAGSSDGTAHLWDKQGNELTSLSGHGDRINSAVFSPDGKTILTASSDHTARLWDRQGNELTVLNGHKDRVLTAMFSSNGQTILTASWDRTARLWDRQGNELALLNGHRGYVYSATFSSDGQTILTASEDNTARLWPTIEYIVREAYWRIKRGFTEEERQQYFRDDPAVCPCTKEELFAPLAHYLSKS